MTKPGRLTERKWFRMLLPVAGGILLLLVAFGIAVAIRWRMSAKEAAAPVLLGEPVYECAAAGPELGTQFNAVLKYRLPWSDSIRRVGADPGKNLQLTSEPEFRRTRIRWGYSDWTVTVPLQAYRSGESGGGTVTTGFFAGDDLETPLPELKVADLTLPMDDDGTELSLAPRIEEKTSGRSACRYIIAAIAVAAVMLVSLAVCILLLRRKREASKPVKPAWETAMEALGAIRAQFGSGLISPETAVASLTDVVRRYLEERFHLRAERQTTAEFLAELNRDDRLLGERDRSFLRSFLTFADMVKFARMQTGPELFEQAAGKAEELVSGTIPHEEVNPHTNPGGRR